MAYKQINYKKRIIINKNKKKKKIIIIKKYDIFDHDYMKKNNNTNK
jgi:hypothetical protein